MVIPGAILHPFPFPGGADTISDVAFFDRYSPPALAREITWALKGTNGQWIRWATERKLLVPIFFCQNTPPNDSLFSELLVTNNVGFSVPQFPDQWPEAAEGVWIHPLCPLIQTGGSAGGAPPAAMPAASAPAVAAAPAPPAPAPVAPVAAPVAAAPATNTPAVAAAPVAAAPATNTPAVAAAPATAVPQAPPGYAYTPQPPPGYVLTKIEGPAGPDTLSASGVFKTKADFEKGAVLYGSTVPMEEKGLLSWFPVEYSAYGVVRVKGLQQGRKPGIQHRQHLWFPERQHRVCLFETVETIPFRPVQRVFFLLVYGRAQRTGI